MKVGLGAVSSIQTEGEGQGGDVEIEGEAVMDDCTDRDGWSE